MATDAATRNLRGLARALAQHGLMPESEAESLQNQAQAANITFVEQVLTSNIQLVRPRMWLEGNAPTKTAAYDTLYAVMRRLCVLLAPFTPHVTETMYQNLRLSGDPESVHMLSWFPGDGKGIDRGLEQGMEIVRSFDEAQAYARQSGKRKLRWPVRECVVVTDEDEVEAAMTSLSDICRERANAREVRVARGRYDRSGWKAEPVMKALGPVFGKKAPRVKELILAADASRMKASLDRGETVILESNGESFSVVASQVSFSEELPPGVFSAPMKGGVVYLDITLTPAPRTS